MDLLFLELIRIAVGLENRFSKTPSQTEWSRIYMECQKQAVVGVAFLGVQRLPEEQRPPKELLYQWIALDEVIKSKNHLMNQRCLELQRLFSEGGFNTCILKGQGNALMYPTPDCRQSGDIDIWLTSQTEEISRRLAIKRTVGFLSARSDIKDKIIGYHHMEFPLWNDVEVEVHWRPSWRSSPILNYRMQKWFLYQKETQFQNTEKSLGLHVPTWDFNVIYQLQHMFLHLFQEGVGLRQVMDYYFLLKSDNCIRNDEFVRHLRYLGLYRFGGAVMYIMKEVFSLNDKYMIAPIDEVRGRDLLKEVLQSGNFGQFDDRNKNLRGKQGLSRSLARIKRQVRFVKYYPHETLCAPFQIYHVIWRKCRLWRWE